MKNMKNRKKIIFQLFFPLDSGPTKDMAPINFFYKKGFFFRSVLRAASIFMDLA